MFKSAIENLANSKTKKDAISNSEKVREEFNKLTQPIDSISTNREMMESTIEMFIKGFDYPTVDPMLKDNLLMLRGFAQF